VQIAGQREKQDTETEREGAIQVNGKINMRERILILGHHPIHFYHPFSCFSCFKVGVMIYEKNKGLGRDHIEIVCRKIVICLPYYPIIHPTVP
jgi:hypothetical protein